MRPPQLAWRSAGGSAPRHRRPTPRFSFVPEQLPCLGAGSQRPRVSSPRAADAPSSQLFFKASVVQTPPPLQGRPRGTIDRTSSRRAVQPVELGMSDLAGRRRSSARTWSRPAARSGRPAGPAPGGSVEIGPGPPGGSAGGKGARLRARPPRPSGPPAARPASGAGGGGRCALSRRSTSRSGSSDGPSRRRSSADPRSSSALLARPPLRRVGRLALGLQVPDHVGQRPGQLEHPADRVRPTGADQAVGILAGRQGDEAQALARPQQRQRPLGGALGGAAAGIVAVEAEVGLVGQLPQSRRAGPRSARCRAAPRRR